MTKVEIIDETVQFYSEDVNKRAIIYLTLDGKSRSCVYLTPDQRNCAFGRCMSPDSLKEADKRGSLNTSINSLLSDLGKSDVDDILRVEYIGHPLSFWQDVQTLHDIDEHWNEKGLSDKGIEYVNELKEKWKQK